MFSNFSGLKHFLKKIILEQNKITINYYKNNNINIFYCK